MKQVQIAQLPGISDLDAITDPARRIMLSCEHAKILLADALEGGKIEQIIEIKSKAEGIRAYTIQKQLGKDVQLSGAEIVRRAERCLALTVRKGQSKGTVTKQGQLRSDGSKLNPASIFHSPKERTESYVMADGVSDKEFEVVIKKGRTQGTLSRASVVRRLKGNGQADRWSQLAELAASGATSHQIAKKLGVTQQTVSGKAKKLGIVIQADCVIGKTRMPDPERIFKSFIETLEALTPSCEHIEPKAIRRRVLKEYAPIMFEAMKQLRKLERRVKEATSG